MSIKDIAGGWNKFFFEPRPTEGIALFRIIWVGLIGIYFLLDLQNIHDFYGPHALISMEASRPHFTAPHLNVFQYFTLTYASVYFVMALYGVSLLCAFLGFFTRISLVTMLICMVSLHQRNIWLLSSSELLMRAITIYLVCSPCGHSLSLDSILGRKYPSFRRERNWAPWALRLIQIQLSVVYVWTVWHKLKGEDWIDGSAVYYATRLESLTNFPMPVLLDSVPFIRLATWATLLIELALGTLVWIKEFRKPVIIAGIFFHLGIEYMMSIPFFELYMIALIINFFTPEELKSFVDRSRSVLVQNIEDSTLLTSVKERLLWVARGKNEVF